MLTFKRIFVSLLTATLLMLTATSLAAPSQDMMTQYMSYVGNDKLPGPWSGIEQESPESRRQRINMIAEVIDEQAPISAEEHGWYWSVDDLKLAAFTKTWYESGRFRLMVHNGKVRGDHGKSVCLGQIMYGGKKLIGTDRDSTKRCIAEVMKHLIMHQRRCLTDKTAPSPWAMAKVFAGYGTGSSCKESEWMPVRDEGGKVKLDDNGNPIKDYWARNRSYTWWKLRQAFPTFQPTDE